MEYKLFAVRVFVTEWERAIRFYSETLEMTIAYQSDEMGWAQMAPGVGQLALERVDRPILKAGRWLGALSASPSRFLTSSPRTTRWPSAESSSWPHRRSSRGAVSLRISATPTGTS